MEHFLPINRSSFTRCIYICHFDRVQPLLVNGKRKERKIFALVAKEVARGKRRYKNIKHICEHLR